MTIAEKLQTIIDIKSDIKEAINEKGVSVTDTDSFASYADKIKSIETGGSSGGSGDDESTLIQLIEGEFDSFIIPNGVTKIKKYLFYTQALNSITIPNSVTSIGEYAFSGNYFNTLTLSEGLKTIYRYAFYNCRDLVTIILPDSITSIEDYAFANDYCMNLDKLPENLITIGKYAFSWVTGMRIDTIPNKVTTIGNNAFEYAYGMTAITIPDSVTSIGDEAFVMAGLQKVWLPSTVKTVGSKVFPRCTIYTDVASEDDIPEGWDAQWKQVSNQSYSCTVVYGATYEDYQNVPVTAALNVDTEDEDMPEDVDNE